MFALCSLAAFACAVARAALPAAAAATARTADDGLARRIDVPRPADDAATPPRAGTVRFTTVDVYVDPGDRPLAAYQFTLRAVGGAALLVGLEGGDRAGAFADPPYYDPAALIGERVVVAGLTTADALPRGRTRVARLHVQVTGPADPRYEVALHAAAGPDGRAMAGATVEAVLGR